MVSASAGTRYSVGCGFSTTGDRKRSWGIETTTYLRVRPPQFKRLRELTERHVVGLQQLLTLATDHPCSMGALHATIRVPKRRSRGWEHRPVVVYSQPRFASTAQGTRRPSEDHFVFTLEDLGSDFGARLGAWEVAREELDSVFGLYFSARFGQGMLLDQRFTYYVQAAESYHRRRIGGSAVPMEEHERRLGEVLAGTPEAHRKWLRDRLQYSNEPNLRRRLKELFRLVPEVRDDLVAHPGKFIQTVLDTRNYFTHHDRRLKGRHAQGERLYRVTEALRYLLSGVLLKEVGFDDSRIADLLRCSEQYRYAMRFRTRL